MTERVRRVRFGSFEHQQREIYARDIRHSAADSRKGISYYGDGKHVMAVCQNPQKGSAWIEIIGENGLNIWGEPFVYDDYFVPADLGGPMDSMLVLPPYPKHEESDHA